MKVRPIATVLVALLLLNGSLLCAQEAGDPGKQRDLEKKVEELQRQNQELEKKLKDKSGTAPVDTATVGSGSDATTKPPVKKDENFFIRLGQTLWEDVNSPAYSPPEPNAPPPHRRRETAPFDAPPFPVGEWQMNGTVTIGDANEGTPYPSVIMDTLYNGPDGQWWKDSRLALYGWFNFGGNISNARDSNAPTGYIIRPNKVEIDQIALYLERRPDENQQDHFDWGFRVTGIYGLDYRFTTMKGVWDEQLHIDHRHPSSQLPAGNIWGYDIPMCYVDLYVPGVAEGMNIRIGRFISVADIEAQLAPDNLMYTHSLLYTYDIFTQVGGIATIKLDDMWAIQVGIVSGNDVAPWEHRRFTIPNSGPTQPQREVNHGVVPSAVAMIQWIGPKWLLGQDSLYFGVNGINGGRFGYNNIQEAPVVSWTHKFNEYVFMQTEGWYMFETNNPLLGYTWVAAVVNYTMFRLGPNTFFTIRNEYFNDAVGARTTFKSTYSEHTFGFTYWFNKLVTFRPEFGYWHSYDARAFDNGRRADLYLLAGDVIIHF